MIEAAVNWLEAGDDALSAGNMNEAATRYLHGAAQLGDTDDASRRLMQLMRNRGSYLPIGPRLRRRLSKFYRPHNQELEDLLGSELGWQ